MKQGLSLKTLLSAALLVGSSAALAVQIPSGLSITGTVVLDTVNSFDPEGGASQAGSLKQIISGVTTTSSFTGMPSSISPNTLGGALTHIGDGIGASFSMSGTYVDTDMFTEGLFADYFLVLENMSLTQTYTVTFSAMISNSVGASGDDAYAESMIRVSNSVPDEILYSDYRIDTANPGPNNNFTVDSANSSFSVTLLPGESASFSALQEQRGGVFADGSYSASLDAFLRVVSVVPESGSLPMMSLGLLALALTQRHRRRRG